MFNQAEQLERKHRQYAGHQVQDNPADKGEEKQQCDSCRRCGGAFLPLIYFGVVFFYAARTISRTIYGTARAFACLAVQRNGLACGGKADGIVAGLVVERYLGSKAIVVCTANVLYGNLDAEGSAESPDFQFQGLVVFLDGLGPLWFTKFDSCRLGFDGRWFQKFVGDLVCIHMPFVGNGNGYGQGAVVL